MHVEMIMSRLPQCPTQLSLSQQSVKSVGGEGVEGDSGNEGDGEEEEETISFRRKSENYSHTLLLTLESNSLSVNYSGTSLYLFLIPLLHAFQPLN